MLTNIRSVAAVLTTCTILGGCQNMENPQHPIDSLKPEKMADKDNAGHIEKISWRRDLDAALAEAKKSGKLVLTFFNIPSCWECIALREDGFSDPDAESLISEKFVPLMFLTFTDKEATEAFNINWSPSLVVLDENGKEHYRSYGRQDGGNLRATLLNALGRADFNRKRYKSAIKYFDEVIDTLQDSSSIAEAYYWKGACYDKLGDMATTAKIFTLIADKYPDTHWGRAASAIKDTKYVKEQ